MHANLYSIHLPDNIIMIVVNIFSAEKFVLYPVNVKFNQRVGLKTTDTRSPFTQIEHQNVILN